MVANARVKTAISAFAMMLLLTSAAVAQEMLDCNDADVTGFAWGRDGSGPIQTSFNPIAFSVVVVDPTHRLIKFSVYPKPVMYNCFSPIKDTATSFCTSTLVKAVEPVIFRGSKFERVANYSKFVHGQSIGLAVAYGTCVRR